MFHKWDSGIFGLIRFVSVGVQMLARVGIEAAQKRELKEARWSEALHALMTGAKKTDADAVAAPKGALWKINLARKLRQKEGASITWIAENLRMGKPGARAEKGSGRILLIWDIDGRSEGR